MVELLIHVIVVACLGSGLILFTGGGVGILRMPDFYSRLHPAGKLDTLGLMLMVVGLAVYNITWQHFDLPNVLVSVKMLLIAGFMFHSSPTATHAIVDAGIQAGMMPWRKTETRRG
ncbi:cation:proton antiporter [Desulfovermiculus halophilus]|jgi:multicomponent Na+:H+ antiporter subunit G|uniref:cation:proton antiporter n=1 Tax=Desulfovermiculus halophilus TaxID=339722 RepID=UPI0004811E91|nr:monovalent cation/H(+) antiporter subunit G [Desulfovermiculus halophilus]